MQCSKARSLFSARLDNELDAATAARVAAHVAGCRSCSLHWESFAATVSMVRGLPEVAPDPSFVGKVLDRVRAYEAGRIDLEPISESAPDLWGRLVARLSELTSPVPVRMAGALAIGVVVGILIVGPDKGIPFGHVLGPDQARESRTAVSASVAVPTEVASSRSAALTRPFGDLADEQALSPQVNQQDSSGTEGTERFVPGVLQVDPMGPSRQVLLDEANGRPQITF